MDYMFIDGSDNLVESEWRFQDGSLMTYTNFEPTDLNLGTIENCLVMYRPYGYKWGDVSCTGWNFHFAREIETY